MILVATGHRPNKLGGYDAAAHFNLTLIAQKYLKNNTPQSMIIGMAQGWDQAVAYVCVQLKIPFVAAVPFIGQEKEWPLGAQERYNMLIGKASEVKIVSEGGYEAWKMQRRNVWMVDHGDQVMACWDGTGGGTANCIKYARVRGKAIVNLYGEWMDRGP